MNSKQELFIKRMTENTEQAKWGFEILLKRDDFADFFDHLSRAGLFSPVNNSGPIPATDPKYLHIPYWYALNYLKAVAEHATAHGKSELILKILTILLTATQARDVNGQHVDNYQTNRIFAEILGVIPTANVTEEHLDLIPNWLSSQFDRSLVGIALSKGLLQNLLMSNKPSDHQKACVVLTHCLAINWVDDTGRGRGRKKPKGVLDSYWLEKLVKDNVETFAKVLGEKAVVIFRNIVRDLFGENFGDLPTYLSRPAIEDHTQNHSWDGLVNSLVDGFRDILLFWVESDPQLAKEFIAKVLNDSNEMVKRVGIYVLNQKWDNLSDLYAANLDSDFFSSRNIHESYHLLKDRFALFTNSDQAKTIQALRKLPFPSDREDAESIRLFKVGQWLTAIANKGNKHVDHWIKNIQTSLGTRDFGKHPDFNSYTSSGAVVEESPYTPEELIVFAERNELIERLNDFQQGGNWQGPSVHGLANSIENAIVSAPCSILRILSDFCDTKRPYQYAVINGFKRLWELPTNERHDVDWDATWSELFLFLHKLIGTSSFWSEEVDDSKDFCPNRDWIPGVISEFLRAGTRDDKKLYPDQLLPDASEIIQILLNKSKLAQEAPDDPMSLALNSPKGKAVEALISHALRICRHEDAEHGKHLKSWLSIEKLFDHELDKCKNSNFEFSTLLASSLPNINYMSPEWLKANFNAIFNKEFSATFLCSFQGMTYSSANLNIYELLVEHDVLINGLSNENLEQKVRDRVVELTALHYFWDKESLKSPLFTYMFDQHKYDDLEAACNFFSGLRNENITQDQINRVLIFTYKCVSSLKAEEELPKSLLKAMSRLVRYVFILDEKAEHLLLTVAPYVDVRYGAGSFIKELDRLIEVNAEVTSKVFNAVLMVQTPASDYKNRWINFLKHLDKKGLRRDVLGYANKMRNVAGIPEYFQYLMTQKTHK